MEYPTKTQVQEVAEKIFADSELTFEISEDSFYHEIELIIIDPKTKKYDFWTSLPYRTFFMDKTYDLETEIKTVFDRATKMLPKYRIMGRVKRISQEYRKRFYLLQDKKITDAKVNNYVVTDLTVMIVTKISKSGKTVHWSNVNSSTLEPIGDVTKVNKWDKEKNFAVMSKNQIKYWQDKMETINYLYEKAREITTDCE